MGITLMIIVSILALFLGWILSQTFNVRPWVASTADASTPDSLPAFFTKPRIGMAVFLAAVSSFFALTISVYGMRMQVGNDWTSIPIPGLLWFNTGLLLAASASLHLAWRGASAGSQRRLRLWLTAGGALTVAFVTGQYLVWQQLHDEGYYLAANPANSFFYLMTALHAVHILGGLVVWAATMAKAWLRPGMQNMSIPLELCTIYWHYLLILWAVLFGLLVLT